MVAVFTLAFGWAVVVSAVPPAAAEKPKERPTPNNVRQLLQDRNYPAALQAIDEASKKPGASTAQLAYLRARTIYLQGKYADAADAFAQVVAKHGESSVARQARFGEALAKMRAGDFRAAELIYREQATRLLSEDRQQEIAALYLEFAEFYLKPPKEEQKPDYAKALEFYRKALEAGPRPEKRVEVELLVARCLQELKQFAEAATLLTHFAKEHAASPLIVEALHRLGECQMELNQPREARRTWQDLLAEHAKSKSDRIPQASYSLGRTWGMPEPGNEEQLEQGVAALQAFLNSYPEHKLAGKAALEIATAYLHRQRSEEAVGALRRLLDEKQYVGRPEIPDARVLLGKAYQSQKKFAEAIAAWKEYLAKHPAHSAWSQVQADLVTTEFLIGQEHQAAKQYADAVKSWTDFLSRHPLDARAADIQFQFGQMNFDQGRFAEAIADWKRLVAKYPNTEISSQAQFRIAEVLEAKLSQPEEALKEYRALTWGSALGPAQQRVAWLTAKGMTIATERVFRTNETPALKLTSRNLDAVTVRAWTVDLETYFRKMHLARGVESLDVALIDPDKTFEFKVPGYAEYRELVARIPVETSPLAGGEAAGAPIEGKPGVLAVTVSSKAMEATSLLIRSDLEILVKASRDEVFVFAQNLRTGKPWPKARLLLSDGRKVFAEAETGPDGVFHRSYDELKSAGDVRVFAVADGHTASNVVGLNGLGVAAGLSPRGYIYTDRPGYRAGQMVHFRGIVRDAAADAYTVPKGRKLTVEVFDPRNRLLRSAEVVLNDFGAFQSQATLPSASPPGTYRIAAREESGRSYETSFEVAEYRLEPVRIQIDSPRAVYYRGETIEGTITASYYYGAPLVDKEIRYQLQAEDEAVTTARTDAKGQIKFKFPTRKFRESQTLALRATLPEVNVSAGRNFVISTTGFGLSVHTPRSVYVQGESFEAAVTAKDAEGKPHGEKLTLKVLERTEVDGKVGERLVESHDVETDAKTGVGRATLTLEKGATYVLRAEGVDRFHNTVAGQAAVVMSDDRDQVRLRILAEQLTFRTDDVAEVVVHWREQPALALVAYQGARVLGYQLVELAKGANKLRIPMTVDLAPNFELSVIVMTDARPTKTTPKTLRLHEASTPVAVERDLRLAVHVQRKDGKAGAPQPGEDVEVHVDATDAQGKPAAAEIGMALVEQALLDQFDFHSAANPIAAFFVGGARQIAVRTASSVTFDYSPQTRPINSRLLAEKDREEVAAMERESLAAAGDNMMGRAAGLPMDLPAFAPPGGPMGVAGGFGGGRVMMLGRAPGSGRSEITKRAKGAKRQSSQSATHGLAKSAPTSEFDVDAIEKKAETYADESRVDPAAKDRKQLFAEPNLQPHYDNFRYLAENGAAEVQLFYEQDGKAENLNFSRWQALGGRERERQMRKVAKEVAAAGGLLMAIHGPQETGYWNPSILTDAAGKAVVSFTLPERSTAWRLFAKGVTKTTLAGEAEAELVVRKDLFGDLKLPLAFTDGDKTEVEVSVVNELMAEGNIVATLAVTIGDKTAIEKMSIAFKSKGRRTVRFPTTLTRPAGFAGGPDLEAAFTLTIEGGGRTDSVQRVVPIRPFGLSVYSAASGSAESDATVFVDLPAEQQVAAPGLQILVGPSVERSLLDSLFGAAPWQQVDAARTWVGLDSTVSDLQAALGLQKLLAGTREAGGPEAAALDARVRSMIGALVAAQGEDGGWVWAKQNAGANQYTTARVVWGLAAAKAAGYRVPDEAMGRAIHFLTSRLAQISNTDSESTVVVLHALTAAGHGDFAVANRLHRNRPNLSNPALAYLALTLAAMDRKPMAAEVLTLLGARNLDDRVRYACLPWNRSDAELRALICLAEQSVDVVSPRTKPLVDWLLAHRTGHRWSPDKATGPAILALSQWFSRTRFDGERYQLAVFVNEALFETLEVDPTVGTRLFTVPTDRLKPGRQRIQFRLTGRGRYTYQCVYGGFVPADKVKSTTDDWTVLRTYEPALLEVDGKSIPRGFEVLQGAFTVFHNPLTQLPVGTSGAVTLTFRRMRPQSVGAESFPYFVVAEPIPNGATVVESSIVGGFERYEITPGSITFYLAGAPNFSPIHYTLAGYLPGEFRAAPTVLRDAYRPDRLAVGPSKTMTVLPLGARSGDEYKLSPRELFELGKLAYAKHDWKTAGEQLTQLFNNWSLRPEVYKETARMLLDVHLETGPAAMVVRYFEIIKEKYPELEIPFAQILKVGAAYHEIGEYERSFLVFRATVEGSFLKESAAAGFLETQGEFLRSVAFMRQLLANYPPEPYIAGAAYALAQRVYAKAPEATADVKLREKRIGRTELTRQAVVMLDDFLTDYPDDPAADQAAFAMANALLDVKAYKAAIERCRKFAVRYAKSDFLDSYWYVIGYGHFALGEAEAAVEMCRKVADAKRLDKTTGREVESPNKWQAVYILGQVYHSLGRAAEAIAEYARVAERYLDARQAIEYFTRKAVSLPDAVNVKPGEQTTVELKFRNVPSVDVKAYRIDLMKFSLLRRDLGNVTAINLAGIRPFYEAVVKLGDGKDYRDRTRGLSLPLKEEGAYLVVCRAEDLYASGLVLVTPLVVEVQEELTSGRIRTTVKNLVKDRYVADVQVRVIGSQNPDFVSGATDLRGVFVADGIHGRSTVIARTDGGYAFHRGKEWLGETPAPAAPPNQAANGPPGAPPQQPQLQQQKPQSMNDGENGLLDNLRRGNNDIQNFQNDKLNNMYKGNRRGVDAKSAY